MADILTLAEARSAVGPIPAVDITPDADLNSTYIPSTTAIVEDLVGPVMSAGGRVLTVGGGQASILLPSAFTSITSIVESGIALTAGTDFTVNPSSGIIMRGSSTQSGACFKSGQQNVVITYAAGSAATAADAPPRMKLGARIILRQLWLADRVGRPQFGAVETDVVETPSGFAIPRRAYEILIGSPAMPGFA